MANIDFSVAPYYDRFDPTKNRTRVLFQPDRGLQQSELNELQSIAIYNIRSLGDRIFTDGDIQSGMSFSIDTTAKTITVDDGTIYLAGSVRQFSQQTIAFQSTGVENIGVTIAQTVITSTTDASLLDPTQNVPTYMSQGADRLQETVVLTYNDDTTSTIYKFTDGSLFTQPDRPEYSTLNTTLAQRTYDESGSYQVEGFKMYTETSATAGMIDLMIDKGTAYVLGYRINKTTSSRIPIAKSTTSNNVAEETHTYASATGKVLVGSSYVKTVNQVIAHTACPSGGITVTKGALDGRDAIPSQYTSIDPASLNVWTSSPAKTFTISTDYNLVTDSGVEYIDWNTGANGTEPAVGASYFVSFNYDAVMKENTDYKVTTTLHTADSGWDTYVDWTGMTGLKPIDQGLVNLAYDYYLARADTVTLDKDGNFTVLAGQPDRIDIATAPPIEDPLSLKIGNVFVFPNSDSANATNNGIVRLSMSDLQDLKSRLENVEYNQSIIALEDQSTANDDPLALRGVFADAFVDFSRLDPSLSSIAMSFDDASMTLQVTAPSNQMETPAFDAGNSTATSWGRLITAPYTEIIAVNQPLATEAMNVNPYAVYNKMGVLKLSPSSDNWIEDAKVVVNKTAQETVLLDRWWAHRRKTTSNPALRDLVNTIQLDGNQKWNMGMSWQQDVLIGRTGTLTNVASTTRDSAIEYMRQVPVTISATNLEPNTNNLYLTFDGVTVPLTPTGTTIAGANTGTIQSDAKGNATASFTIPPNIRTGVREVTLQNATNQATSTFVAQGTMKTTTEVITRTHVTIHLHDPLAQSFQFNEDRVVTSFDLYFGSKSSTDNIVVQVRGLSDGGFPNQTVYAERTLTPANINVSSDATAVTKVALDDPLMCSAGTSYCIVIITDSNEYTLWVATMGQNRKDNSATVVTQPYVDGVLFSSSNARTWTVHQMSDLKFTVYTAVFNPTATIQFTPMQNLNSDMLLLMATYLTPQNTGCTWEARIVSQADASTVSLSSVPWVPLANYIEQATNSTIVGLVELQATFTANKYISPMLTLEDLLFVNFISQTDGDYVTLNIDTSSAPYNTVTMAYDANLPAGTTVTPYYSTDGGTTWVAYTEAPTTSPVSADYTRYSYTHQLSTTQTYNEVKFKLSLHADNRFVRPRVRRFTAVFKQL